MLGTTQRETVSGQGLRLAIVCSLYNKKYTDGMLEAAQTVFTAAGAERVEVYRVPGAFEIPVVAAALARRTPKPSAIVCLGLIIQGETNHADHIGSAVTDGLMQISIQTGVPCIHEVLTVKTEAQAQVRCINPETNRGAEAAHTALAVALTLKSTGGEE